MALDPGTHLGPYEPVDCVITHTYMTPNLVLENDAEWASFDVTSDGPEPKVKVNDKITPDVTFGCWSIERTFPMIAAEARAVLASFQPPL